MVAVPAFGQQLTAPLHIGTTTPILNEFGLPLPGNYLHNGALVVVYTAPGHVIYPPDVRGNPHPNNLPVAGGESRIGRLTRRNLETPAMFGLALSSSSRPPNGTPLFVRVFNGQTPETSSFYGDSEVFVVSGNQSFNVTIPSTSLPLDPADDDGDGLNNSWERSYGTDPFHPDTSGNGMTDYEAVMAGLNPLDPDDVLTLTIPEVDQSRIIFRWPSRAGGLYQVEYTDSLANDAEFHGAGEPFVADDAFTEYDVSPWFGSDGARIFRLRLILPPSN
ncbi:MAG TPA: thrombospondin type 3 repeat-containing protein [Kiritimatiellia bacterium]|nr:thrombospondin type 3 repeat-containing protein [Kiritimatiellia bacterium]